MIKSDHNRVHEKDKDTMLHIGACNQSSNNLNTINKQQDNSIIALVPWIPLNSILTLRTRHTAVPGALVTTLPWRQHYNWLLLGDCAQWLCYLTSAAAGGVQTHATFFTDKTNNHTRKQTYEHCIDDIDTATRQYETQLIDGRISWW